jgi:DNA-binding NarL/FixJ family response regulator
MSIRVLIVDDHEVVRRGLATLLADTEIEIVADASGGEQALQLALEHKPDVVLMDIRMPDADGLATLKRMRSELPDIRVIMLSTYDNPTYVARSIAMGATDYILTGAPRDEIVRSIRGAATGQSPPPDSVISRVKGAMSGRQRSDDDIPLTGREMQVLRHIALGLSNREIGDSLEISIETVKEHVQNILRKINAVDRTQAAVWAVKRGLV